MKVIKRNQARKLHQHRQRMVRLFFAIIILIVLGWGGCHLFQRYQSYRLDRYDRFAIRGVSINQQNGYVDFVALKNAGQNFVYLRATQGAIFVDNNFSDNYQRSVGSGINVGVYHVFSFDSSPLRQLINFKRTVGSNTGNLPIAIQLNANYLSKKQLNAFKQFIEMMQKHYRDGKLIIWTAYSVFNQIHLSRLIFWDDRADLRASTLSFVNANQPISIDGQVSNFHQSVFNGSKKQWQMYLSN